MPIFALLLPVTLVVELIGVLVIQVCQKGESEHKSLKPNPKDAFVHLPEQVCQYKYHQQQMAYYHQQYMYQQQLQQQYLQQVQQHQQYHQQQQQQQKRPYQPKHRTSFRMTLHSIPEHPVLER